MTDLKPAGGPSRRVSYTPADLAGRVNQQRHPDIAENPPQVDPPHSGEGPTTHSAYGAQE